MLIQVNLSPAKSDTMVMDLGEKPDDQGHSGAGSNGTAGATVIDASISIAAGFSAHLDTMAVSYIAASTEFVGAGAAVGAVFEAEREQALQRTAAAFAVFEAEARNAGIAYQCLSIEDMPADATASIGAAALLYDPTVVLQPEMARGTFDNTTPIEILLKAGGGAWGCRSK